MFSGIVECKGKVSKIAKNKDYFELEIAAPSGFNKNLKRGASVAVDGVCLTSKDHGKNGLKFDVISETISRTKFSNLKVDDEVNLERSIKASSEIGGHLMSGHIQCTGTIVKVVNKDDVKDIRVEIPSDYSHYLIEKGYIGINGCSLTIGVIENNFFYIHLIPETLEVTNISNLKNGDQVNIEVDQNTVAIVDTVKSFLLAQKSS